MLSGGILGFQRQTCGDYKIGERRNSPGLWPPTGIRSQGQGRRIGHVIDERIARGHDGGPSIAESVNNLSVPRAEGHNAVGRGQHKRKKWRLFAVQRQVKLARRETKSVRAFGQFILRFLNIPHASNASKHVS